MEHDGFDEALLVSKFLRPERGGALRRDDARNLLRRTMEVHAVRPSLLVHAWAFLPSRVDLVIGLPSPEPVADVLSDLFGYYTRRFNARYGKQGALFRSKFVKRLLVGGLAITEAIDRLHDAPADAECRARPGAEPFSSAPFYRAGAPDLIVTPYLPAVRRREPVYRPEVYAPAGLS